MKFDDAETYFLNFTSKLPNAAGGIPIGLYLLWASDAGLVPPLLKDELDARRARGQSAADMLFDLCDGKLTSEEFNEEGVAFTDAYYGTGYIADYQRCFRIADASVDALCAVPDTAASLARLKSQLNERLISWRAQPRAEPMRQKTGVEVFAQLQQELLPELRADGFEEMTARGQEILVRRRVGPLEQVLLFMAYDGATGPAATFFYYLGAERVRRVWLRLSDARHHAAPPPAFAAAVRTAPDVHGNDLSLTLKHEGYAPYYRRIAAGPEQLGRIVLAHYCECIRPRMNALDSIAALAEQVRYFGQQLRLRNQIGAMGGAEVLARVVLLSAYGDHLRGPEGPELLQQLREQIRRNIHRSKDEFPTVEDLDALVAALAQPGVVGQVRAFLDQ